jgi:hypothetical protein
MLSMKHILFVCSFFLISFSHAHDYFFAFAEVEYDEYNARVEATLVMTTHDFESYLRKKNIINKELSYYKNDSLVLKQVETEILKHFSISSPSIGALSLEGFEIELTGMIQVYLTAPILSPAEGLDIQFDLLMDEYKEQQNKLTFIYRDQKTSYVYLQNKRSQHIDFY